MPTSRTATFRARPGLMSVRAAADSTQVTPDENLPTAAHVNASPAPTAPQPRAAARQGDAPSNHAATAGRAGGQGAVPSKVSRASIPEPGPDPEPVGERTTRRRR